MAKIQIKSDKITPLGGIFFYIRASNCESLYNDIFALRGWEKVEINNVEMELNSILVRKWSGKVYRLVIQRQKRMDGTLGI